MHLIESGKLKVKELITQRFSLEEVAEAFKTAMNSVESLKVMILNN